MNDFETDHPLDAEIASGIAGFDGLNLVQPGEMPLEIGDRVPWWNRPSYRLFIVGMCLFVPIVLVLKSVTGSTGVASQDSVAATSTEPSGQSGEMDRLLEQNMLLQQRLDTYEGTSSEIPSDELPADGDDPSSMPAVEVPETRAETEALADAAPTETVPVAAAPSLSPNERWSRSARSGSFGSIPADRVARADGPPASVSEDSPALSARVETAGERQRYEPFFPSGRDDGSTEAPSPEVSSPGSIASVPIDEDGENFILRGTVRRTVAAGATATGRFDAPFYWVPELGDISYRIVTDEAVSDRQGNVAFPSGTTFVSSVDQVLDNGLVLLNVREAITPDGATVPLQGVSVKGEAGSPLVAERERLTEGTARRDAITAVLGGLSAAAQELTRSSTSSSYSFSSIGSSGSHTVDDSDRNPAAAFVGGSIDAVLPDIQERNRAAVQQLQQTDRIWTLDAEQPVEIVFNQTVQL